MNIYNVTFKDNAKTYYFDGGLLKLKENDKVIVDTERGQELAKIASKYKGKPVTRDIKKIIKIATEEDYNTYLENAKDAKEALKKAIKYANELKLDMKFVDASYSFDRKVLLFSFYANDRVDFRELAKKLANIYHTRIDLRQIGVRDKAQLVGGIGVCGRKLCCASTLGNLCPVSINMAKNQNIALNPSKINGACGRLMCCLAYENDIYESCSYGMPEVGQTVKTKKGQGKVISVDILNRKYKALVNEELVEVVLDEK